MSENVNQNNCNHQCSSCGVEGCGGRKDPADMMFHLNPRSSVRKIIGVVSGKGGVGKSFVTSMLAAEMQRRGHRTAVLDGDITGPSQAMAFGIHEPAMSDGEVTFPAVTPNGIQVISTNMLLDRDDVPVLWRGPLVSGILKQFYEEVFWDDVDYMFVDMPPGTSDVPLTLFQSFPLDGIVVVTSPQELVSMVVAKAINMAKSMNVNIIGLIENMAYVKCPCCDEKILAFGRSHIQETAAKYGLPVIAQVPLDPRIAEAGDAGTMEDLEIEEIKTAVDVLENIG